MGVVATAAVVVAEVATIEGAMVAADAHHLRITEEVVDTHDHGQDQTPHVSIHMLLSDNNCYCDVALKVFLFSRCEDFSDCHLADYICFSS